MAKIVFGNTRISQISAAFEAAREEKAARNRRHHEAVQASRRAVPATHADGVRRLAALWVEGIGARIHAALISLGLVSPAPEASFVFDLQRFAGNGELMTHDPEEVVDFVRSMYEDGETIEYYYKRYSSVDDVVRAIMNDVDGRQYRDYIEGVVCRDHSQWFDEAWNEWQYEEGNFVTVLWRSMERQDPWIVGIADRDKYRRVNCYCGHERLDEHIKAALDAKKSFRMRTFLGREIPVTVGKHPFTGAPFVDWDGTSEPVCLLESDGDVIMIIRDDDMEAKWDQGQRMTLHHSIGFLSDETRSPESMLDDLFDLGKESEVCASLSNEWLYGSVTALVEGTVTRSFSHNVFSFIYKGKRHVNKARYGVRYAERCGVHKEDLAVRYTNGRLFHELFVKDVKIKKLYVKHGGEAAFAWAEAHGIEAVEAPADAYHVCTCP